MDILMSQTLPPHFNLIAITCIGIYWRFSRSVNKAIVLGLVFLSLFAEQKQCAPW